MAEELYPHPRSPYWYYKVPILDANGHVIEYARGSTKQRDKSQARLVARQKTKEFMERQTLGIKDDPLVTQVIDQFVENTRNDGKSDIKNQLTYQRQLFDTKKPLMSTTVPISRFDRALMSRIKDKYRRNHAIKTTNNLMAFLISVYNYADSLGYKVPLDQKDFEKLKDKTDQKTRYLLEGEETRLLQELDPTRQSKGMQPYPERIGTMPHTKLQDQYDITVNLIDTGCRYTEGTSVPWLCVDTSDWRGLNIYRDKVGNEGFIAFTPRLREIYQRRYRQHGNSPYVFPSIIDPRKPRGYAVGGIENAIERAGLNEPHLVKRFGRFTPHCFRHTFASRLAQAGLSLYSISLLLGHTDTQMTGRYAHMVKQDESEKAAEILGKGYV